MWTNVSHVAISQVEISGQFLEQILEEFLEEFVSCKRPGGNPDGRPGEIHG